MLTILSVCEPEEQRQVFASYNPQDTCWVISDLKSKLELRRRLVHDRGFVPADSVLRASELWRKLLERLRPDLQPVSREFMLALISDKKSKFEGEWAQGPSAAQTAYAYLTQIMPILAHPEGASIMAEWFETHPDSQIRWGQWFDLAHMLWKELLADGYVSPSWAPGLLINENDLNKVWTRSLIVDLGPEMTQVEAELLAQLAVYIDVTVLRPTPPWGREYHKTLAPYELFDHLPSAQKKTSAGGSKEAQNSKALQSSFSKQKEFKKFTTMIAEVKEATAQIRQWLDGGQLQVKGECSPLNQKTSLKPSDIVIAAPNIENYWQALSCYLDQEGIPYQKETVKRLHTFPDVARWLVLLRLRSGSFAETDVEVGLYGDDAERINSVDSPIDYNLFATLFKNIYERSDFQRSPEVSHIFEIEIKDSEVVDRDTFLAWAFKQLPSGSDLDRVEMLYGRMLAECPPSTVLSVKLWIEYTQEISSRIESRVREGDPRGVACINLPAVVNTSASHVVLMGLTESSLRQSRGDVLAPADIAHLTDHFGFRLNSGDLSRLEYEAQWLLSDAHRHFVLTVPETNFDGAVQAPSWFWIRGAHGYAQGLFHHRDAEGKQGTSQRAPTSTSTPTLGVPQISRWDEIQHSGAEAAGKERGWSRAQMEFLEKTMNVDRGWQQAEAFATGSIKHLSPSAIESYLSCPFIFAAKYVFRLSDIISLDLDVDASRRGRLMHALFERLTREPRRFVFSEVELHEHLETAREASKLELGDERLWPSLKMRMVELSRRFLAHERELRARLPNSQTIGTELEVRGFLDPQSGSLTTTPQAGSIRFSGRIDRVDTDQLGHCAVLDYKSTGSGLKQVGSWIKNHQLQLLLYSLALESGLTSLGPRRVLAALYYVAKPMSMQLGFKVSDVEQGLYELSNRARNSLTCADLARLYDELKVLVAKATKGILAGDFRPQPHDQKQCSTCDWRGLCRASHLNT